MREGAEAGRCACVLFRPEIETPSPFLGSTRGVPLPCEGEDVSAMENRYEIGDMKEPLIFNVMHMSSS